MEKTRNEEYGFYGTMRLAGCAGEAWEIALKDLAEETGAEPDEVRDFLDSRWGRHFADTVHCHLATLPLDGAVKAAVREWNSRTLSRRIRRELGIPTPMPYLTGLVYTASFEPQACEEVQ